MTTNFQRVLRTAAMVATIGFMSVSCTLDDGDEYSKSELGAVTKEYKVPAAKGSVDVKVYTNQECTISFTDPDVDWATIDTYRLTADGDVKVTFDANDSFARMAKICIVSAERADTVSIKQYGKITPTLSFPVSSITVAGKGGNALPRMDTNLDLEDLDVKIEYTSNDEGDWIDKYDYVNGFLVCDCQANATENIRNARATVSFVDGWGETTSAVLYLTQANKNEELGTLIGFDEARDLKGVQVSRDVYIEGYVVSSKESNNAGECDQTTGTTIDYSVSDKTAYIESLDGRYGFRIVCKSAADNIFEQYSRVNLLLKGTTILPDYDETIKSYYINGVTSNMVMSAVKGTAASLPKKVKSISQLTDDDIYTYLTLQNCEFPVRKGALTPVNEGYTILYSVNSLAKYPTLFRDINGESMYLMTNVKCPYRRDGSQVPYGSGSLSGVIVHETFTRFNYQDTNDEMTYGQIGRYQLRHQSRADIFENMATDFEDGFSKLAFEVRYAHIENNRALPTIDGMEGYIANSSTSSDTEVRIYGTGDWSYLGPCGTDHKNTTATGTPCGFTLMSADGGPEYTANLITGNNAGKGQVMSMTANSKTLYPAIATQYTWNYDDLTDGAEGSADGFLVCFSTAGITTNHLSMQIAAVNQADKTPRWWKVEWSEGGTKDEKWTYIDTYTSAVAEQWSTRVVWNLSGPKSVNINLPLEMLGKSKVYLRIVPAENVVSSSTKYYDPDTKISNRGNCTISYLGIRYNK